MSVQELASAKQMFNMATVTISKLPGSCIEVTGELGAEEFNKYIERALRSLVEETQLPGFRKGKAPQNLVLESVGEGHLLHLSAEIALKEEWPRVIREHKIEAVGTAEFHVLKLARGNPLVWKATVAILPEFELPSWRQVAKDANKKRGSAMPEITEKEVDDTLAYIQKTRMPEGSSPPPLDDEYAKSLGNFPNLEALRTSIREGIKQEKEEKARQEHRMRILQEITRQCSIETPQILIDVEREKMTRELKMSIEDMGLKWDEYLLHLKKSEADLKESWVEDAKRRVETGLVLREIAKSEKIEPSEEEVAERVETLLRPYREEERQNIDLGRIKEYAYGIVRNDKVFQLLEQC